MAFQISTVFSCVISSVGPLSRSCGDLIGVKFRNITAAANPQPMRKLHSFAWFGKSFVKGPPTKCNSGVERFSTTAAVSKSFRDHVISPKGRGALVYRIALGALGVTAAVASLHGSAQVAMAAGTEKLNLSSVEGKWEETKATLESLPQEERRQYYRTSGFVALEDIPVWTPSSGSSGEPYYTRNKDLDKKISLYSGDITKLEIGAIVNAGDYSQWVCKGVRDWMANSTYR